MPEGTTTPRTVRLTDGAEIAIRAIEPDDKDLLKASFDRLSQESRYRRFLSPKNRLTPRELAFLTEVDHDDHEAVVALHPKREEGIGVARYVRLDDPEVAEVAVVVADDWQRRGVGTALLAELVERARPAGIRRFSAVMDGGNRAMIELLEGRGVVVSRGRDGNTVEMEIELPREAGINDSLASALRAAAAGQLTMAFMLPSGLVLSNRFWARIYSPEGDGENAAPNGKRNGPAPDGER